MRQQQTILFNNSGLDSDTSSRFIVPGNSDYILNDIISFEGNQGARTNIKGNALTQSIGPTYTAIGWVEDIERNSIILFLHDTGNNHRIISLSLNDQSITTIINDQPLLNFSLNYKINHADVIGDLLYWTDGLNQPRKINIEKAINNQYREITEEVITAAKIPPLRPPLLRDVNVFADIVNPAIVQNPTRNFNGNPLITGVDYNAGTYQETTIESANIEIHRTQSTINIRVEQDGGSDIVNVNFVANSNEIGNEITIINQGSVDFTVPTNDDYNVLMSYTTQVFDINDDPITTGLTWSHEIRNFAYGFGDRPTENIGYFSDTNRKINNLREKQFQFAYRYLYDDKEKSIYSPYSLTLIPQNEESVGGFLSGDQTINNRIDFVIQTGSELVDKIEIVIKINELGSWQSYQILDKTLEYIPDNSGYRLKFANENVLQPVDNNQVVIDQNFFPLTADVQEYLTSNELSYGRVKEGFDNINIDIDLSVNFNTYTYNSALKAFGKRIVTRNYAADNLVYDVNFIVLTIPNAVQTGVYSSVVLGSSGLTYNADSNDVSNYPTSIIAGLVAEFEQQTLNTSAPNPWTWETPAGAVKFTLPGGSTELGPEDVEDTELWFPISFINLGTGDIIYNINSANGTVINTTAATSPKQRTYKQGQYQAGIKYADDYGRKSFVQTNDEASILILDDDGDATFAPIKTLTYNIKHLPPDWATTYQMCLTKNLSESNSFQWSIDTAEYDLRLGIGYAILGINNSIIGMNNLIQKTSIQPYVFTKGDRLRRIGVKDPDQNDFNRLGDDNYYEVLGVEFTTPKTEDFYAYDETKEQFVSQEIPVREAGELVYQDNSQKIVIQFTLPDGQTIDQWFNNRVIIEIVSPLKEDEEKLFFEVGDTYKIGNPGQTDRYHTGKTQDQDPNDPENTPAIGLLEEGDYTWKIRYNLIGGIDFPSVDKNVSDFYDSKLTDYGKISVENIEAEQDTYNLIRHSGKYFDNTNINDLNAFQSGNYVLLDDRFGNIQKIIQVGDALKVYQPKKVTSIYIGKSFVKEADGSDQVLTVDRTFGVVNPSELDYGCTFPESVLRNERYVYFYDIYSGTFIRDAANGLEPISRYLMDNYFKTKSQELIKSGIENVEVLTGFDEENNLVFVSFIDSVNSNNNETLAYHEPSNRWISFFSFIPELYFNDLNQFFTYKTGAIYTHNDSTVNRCTFYGTKNAREYTIYANQDFYMPKIYFNLSLFSNNDGWSVPEIIIEPNPNYPNGMKSRINENKFIFHDGVLYADFLRNLLTTSSTESLIDLINGDQLRGEVMALKLSESNNNETNLYQADITFTKA